MKNNIRINLTKEIVEALVGQEIVDFTYEILEYGIEIKYQPKLELTHINLSITLTNEKDTNNE